MTSLISILEKNRSKVIVWTFSLLALFLILFFVTVYNVVISQEIFCVTLDGIIVDEELKGKHCFATLNESLEFREEMTAIYEPISEDHLLGAINVSFNVNGS